MQPTIPGDSYNTFRSSNSLTLCSRLERRSATLASQISQLPQRTARSAAANVERAALASRARIAGQGISDRQPYHEHYLSDGAAKIGSMEKTKAKERTFFVVIGIHLLFVFICLSLVDIYRAPITTKKVLGIEGVDANNYEEASTACAVDTYRTRGAPAVCSLISTTSPQDSSPSSTSARSRAVKARVLP